MSRYTGTIEVAAALVTLSLLLDIAGCGQGHDESPHGSAVDAGSVGVGTDSGDNELDSGADAGTPADAAAILEDIKADMTTNEMPLFNAPSGPGWAKEAWVGMGSAPRGDSTPYWWTPDNPDFKSASPWQVIAPWFVIYPGNDVPTNVRVKISQIGLYVLEKTTNQWKTIDTGNGLPTWASSYSFDIITPMGTAAPRIEPDGGISYKLTPELYPIHGGTNKFEFSKGGIDPANIAAVIMSIRTQLVLDDPSGVDDRASARILLDVGADYYPTITTKVSEFSPMKYVPSVAGSRFGLIKATSRTHYMATIDPPGRSPGISAYTSDGGVVALPVAQLVGNLPSELTAGVK